jgi:hypothetical protein
MWDALGESTPFAIGKDDIVGHVACMGDVKRYFDEISRSHSG